ncbi:hypothetical protein Cni_G17786 [Canna indica]|uniref:t-SNARE coiled-coil homology domain-containing protein n=1 Tax=Canna indica TaxID=4628 RepID=A0AAQ3KHP2_9LILI|nr:hypothetical protein Cni_G17786 [Canna indica]
MNDLLSTTSFKKYANLKQQVQMDNLEAGMTAEMASEAAGANLNKFFEEVESVKKDLRDLESLYRRLQEANEESKLAHSAKAMKEVRGRMDGDIGQVLRKAKEVKAKLEALDRSNAQHRNVPGCGPGSSADRTRTSVVGGLGNKLKDLMDNFQGLRARIAAEYKETVGRRYFTVTGTQADEETIETLISSGASETFMQKAIQEQGRGQVMDTISEIQERHDAVKDIERSLLDLHQVFLDMAALVETQGHQLNDIENHVAHASSFVRRGAVELETAREYQKDSRKWACYGVIAVVMLLIFLLLPILTTLIR